MNTLLFASDSVTCFTKIVQYVEYLCKSSHELVQVHLLKFQNRPLHVISSVNATGLHFTSHPPTVYYPLIPPPIKP